MSTEIPWDKSRMEWKPVDMTVTYNGNMEFTASTSSGAITFPMEAPVGMGGHGNVPNPIQYLVGSLGGCVGVKILLALSDNGIVPEELTIGIHGTRKKTMPAFFDHVHLTITLRADADDAMVSNDHRTDADPALPDRRDVCRGRGSDCRTPDPYRARMTTPPLCQRFVLGSC